MNGCKHHQYMLSLKANQYILSRLQEFNYKEVYFLQSIIFITTAPGS